MNLTALLLAALISGVATLCLQPNTVLGGGPVDATKVNSVVGGGPVGTSGVDTVLGGGPVDGPNQ